MSALALFLALFLQISPIFGTPVHVTQQQPAMHSFDNYGSLPPIH